MSQNVLVVALVILPMLGLACLSVAENLEESGLDGWFTASLFHMELLGAPPAAPRHECRFYTASLLPIDLMTQSSNRFVLSRLLVSPAMSTVR